MARPGEDESMLVGSALLGGVAAGLFASVEEGMAAMAGTASAVIEPMRGDEGIKVCHSE